MKPLYTFLPDIKAYELVQDGYVLGYMRRVRMCTPHSGVETNQWYVSPNADKWYGGFNTRWRAREYLETL